MGLGILVTGKTVHVVGRLLVLALALAACTGGEPAATPSAAPTPSAEQPSPGTTPSASTTAPTASPTASPSELSATPAQELPTEWYEDSDGNVIPDFIETELGYDPDVDECATAGGCAAPGGLGPELMLAGQSNLLVLDSSGSMAGGASGGATKMEAVKEAITEYVVSTPDFVDLGLMVYGHEGSNDEADKAVSCAGIETFAPLGELSVDNVDAALEQFEPTGFTPIAASLEAAGTEFAGLEEQANRVILVSDGIETCDGDPIAAATALHDSGVAVVIDVVGFDVDAEVTGGTYTQASEARGLRQYFRDQARALSEYWVCIGTASGERQDCYNTLTNMARDAIDAAVEEEGWEGTSRQAAAADRLSLDISAERNRMSRALLDELHAEQEEIMAAVEERQRRRRERYGDELSLRPACREGPPGLGGPIAA
jgi:hypothetical protein